jgi:hypothetical protein
MKFFETTQMNWYKAQTLPSKSFSCGYCGDKVSSEKGLKVGTHGDGSGQQKAAMYICPSCNGSVFITPENKILPQPIMGNKVDHVPNELSELYDEARKCTGQGCFTASVLICRKILMNIAVNQGADEGKRFIEYVNYLAEQGFIPPNGRQWVDHIRTKGNEATHEIRLMSNTDAKELLIFAEMLLKFVYEFPSMIE